MSSEEATTIGQFAALRAIRTTAAASDDAEPIELAAAGAGGGDDDGDECATPTSEENKIKPPLACPPAPRKPRGPPAMPRKLGRSDRSPLRVPRVDLAAAFDDALPTKKRIRVG